MEYRKNVNRGYQKLRVWQDAIEYYRLTCMMVKSFPYELKRVASQQIASVDSVHRNIAEGYARRGIREYISFLYVSMASLAESVSGLNAFSCAGQIAAEQFDALDAAAFKIENSLIRLIQELEKKRDSGEWIDTLVREESAEYVSNETPIENPPPILQHSHTPILHHSITPTLQCPTVPSPHSSNTPSPQGFSHG